MRNPFFANVIYQATLLYLIYRLFIEYIK